MRTTQVTPGGIRVCGHRDLTADELSALDELAAYATAAEEARRAALTPEQRDAEDTKRAEGQARLRRLRERT